MKRKSLEDQIDEAKQLAINLGFVATGNVNGKSGPYRLFEVSNGKRVGWVALTALRKGVSPFTRQTDGELISEANSIAEKFDAIATGKVVIAHGVKKLELQSNGKLRLITIGHLREGNNPFLIPIIEEMKDEVKILATSLGVHFTGLHNGKKGNQSKFELELDGRKEWITLAGLREGRNPFRVATIGDQLIQVTDFSKNIGAVSTGNYKREKSGKGLKFEIQKDGISRWISLSHLKEGNDPFKLKTIDEQIEEARMLASNYGLEATGKQNKEPGIDRKFQVTNGVKNDWLSLYHLRIQVNPFKVATPEEQFDEAEKLVAHLGLSLTGKTVEGKYKHRRFEVTNGTSTEWSTLGQLRREQNPFKPGGFDPSRVGYFYLLKVYSRIGDYLNIGITNNYKKRLSSHKTNLLKGGMSYETYAVFEFQDGRDALDFETEVKRKIEKIDLGIEGFRTETTGWGQLSLIEKMMINARGLGKRIL